MIAVKVFFCLELNRAVIHFHWVCKLYGFFHRRESARDAHFGGFPEDDKSSALDGIDLYGSNLYLSMTLLLPQIF